MVVEAPDESVFDPVGNLGVDLGIVNLVADSDGKVHSGQQVQEVRERYTSLKSRLQNTGGCISC
ncbi:MAG: hypothetical protein ACXQT4_06975 [Methanotrichaceae archaeon]